MKKGKTKNTKFHGILATGHTQEEAANQYRLLALGKGAEAKVDASRALAFVTTAGATTQMFNPRTGELDLKTSKKVLANLSFEANASASTVVAQHYQCTAGCGQHFVYDSKALMKFCPVCVHAVTASTEAEDQAVIDQQHDDAEDEDDADDEDEDDSDDDLDDEIDDEVGDDDLGDEDEDEDDESEDDESEDDSSESSDDGDEEDESEDDEDEDDSESSDDEDDESESSDDQPLVIAAGSKAQAVKILREEKRGCAEASASVNYMVCASAECGAHVLAEEDGVTACPSCKSTLVEPPVASLSGDDEDEDEEDDDLSVHDDEDEDDEDEDEDDSSESSDDDEDEDEDDDEDDEDAEDEDEDEDDSSESSSGKPAKARIVASTGAPAPAAVAAPIGTPAAPQGEVQVVEGDLVKVDVLAQIDDSDPTAHKELDVSFSAAVAGAAQWIASYKGVPVATARVEDAGDNKEIFGKISFGHAVIAGAQHLGVKATLKEMGFRPVICEVHMPKRVKAEVEAQMVEARAALATDSTEHAERLMAALATAAIGINRGFFNGVVNPLKATLFSALNASGIKQAEVIIDNAFKATADDYHKVLFAKANELLANPPEVQESLSKAILGTSYQAVASSAPAAESFEARVGGMGTATAASEPAPSAQTVPATSAAHVSQVVASLGKRRV